MTHRVVIKTWNEMKEQYHYVERSDYIQLPEKVFNNIMEASLPYNRVISIEGEPTDGVWFTKHTTWYVDKYMIKRKAYKNDLE